MFKDRFFWTVLCLITSMTIHAQVRYDLQFKYLPGTVYRYNSVETFTSQQDFNGQDMTINGGSDSRINMEVVTVGPDSSLVVMVGYDAMRTFVKSAMMDTVIELKELIGKRTKLTMNRYGVEIGRVTPDSSEFSGRLGMLNKSTQDAGFFKLPRHGIGVGEKWAAKVSDSAGFGEGYITNSGTIEYTLIGPDLKNARNCLKIGFISKSDVNGKISQMGMDFFAEGTNESSGTIWFDSDAGVVVLQEITSTQELTIAASDPVPIAIPMTQIIRSNF